MPSNAMALWSLPGQIDLHVHNSEDMLQGSTPTSTRSKLPTELLNLVFRNLDRTDLVTALRANNALYAVAIQILYQDIRLLTPRKYVQCFQVLIRNPSLPPLVRCLWVSWETMNPTHNLYQLLHAVLKQLTALKSLYLDFPRYHSPTWLLHDCSFSLNKFTTSFDCLPPLAKFLDTQPEITELTLRGLQDDDGMGIHPLLSHLSGVNNESSTRSFQLSCGSLPMLTLFNAVHAGPSIIRTVAKGRPLRLVSVPLFPRFATETLNALALISGTLLRLSVISFDPEAPNFLFSQLVQRFPRLEALHVVLLMTECNPRVLESTATYLTEMRWLQYITFMATMSDSEDINEGAVARLWHQACPTLKTIILPRGKVWFNGGTHSGWSCLDD
ncbi:hypothetical protein AMATHDRAFT_62997 [Amanita thiersii Skay4041]|uniref:F-box domain-containing protein n=1 Tax=Amanita thiersii Skay4041 TaxID=703135 RepID=A0A2A9NJN0_9AGAR|nr:hypothetical protein AMATHDRAFT_62997 [Amanita thiersii Skay4041]